MKVIVSYWCYPYEDKAPAVDYRPKSIERISTTVEDLRNFLHALHSSEECPARILWSKILVSVSDRAHKSDAQHLLDDGFEYLSKCLREDKLGKCYCRINGHLGEYYYGFQVRNLH